MSKLLIDHDDVRAWVAARAGNPAIVSVPDGHGGYLSQLRLVFGQRALNADGGMGPDHIGGVEMISWVDWFKEFESQHMALRVPAEIDGGGSAYQFDKRAELAD